MWFEKFVAFWGRRRAVQGAGTGDPGALAPESVIARFFFWSKDFRVEPKRIKHARLVPREGEEALSALNATGLSEEEIWNWGDRVPGCGTRRAAGRVVWAAQTLRGQRLSVIQDDNPTGHVSIGNWPEAREDRIAIAIELERLGCLTARP